MQFLTIKETEKIKKDLWKDDADKAKMVVLKDEDADYVIVQKHEEDLYSVWITDDYTDELSGGSVADTKLDNLLSDLNMSIDMINKIKTLLG